MKKQQCHHEEKPSLEKSDGHAHPPACHDKKGKPDILLWGSAISVCVLYLQYAVFPDSVLWVKWYEILAESVFSLVNTIWVGVILGVLMVSLLAKIPREFVMSVLGSRRGVGGIVRATAAGVLLDLCSHGILMVGAKLYERGASIGQVMAFLVASPWNSFSLTLVLITLVGWFWTLAFIFLSMLIAVVTGLLFDFFVSRKVLPENTRKADLPDNFKFWAEAKKGLINADYSPKVITKMLLDGVNESKMVVRWILFGVVLAGLVRAFVSPEAFGTYFGPTLAGLGLTVLVATIMEVCSEGSTPIAADLLTRAKAPGNSFAFLMTGVSTDYTEVMIVKDTTKSWKIALFLPLVTVPQVILIAWLINSIS